MSILEGHAMRIANFTAMSYIKFCSIIWVFIGFYALGANPHAKLTMQAAKEIALSKEAGNVKSQEFEQENGRWIYSFDIERDKQIHEVNVDANSGQVVEDSIENPADEAKEKADEKKH